MIDIWQTTSKLGATPGDALRARVRTGAGGRAPHLGASARAVSEATICSWSWGRALGVSGQTRRGTGVAVLRSTHTRARARADGAMARPEAGETNTHTHTHT